MKFVDPSVSVITERDPFKKIERVGRTCYKSEDKITEDSAKKFYKGLVSRKHTAMVEHATFVFQTDNGYAYTMLSRAGHKYLNFTADNGRYLISGNLRALNESGEFQIIKALREIDPDLVYMTPPGMSLVDDLPSALKPVDFSELKNVTENEFLNHFYMTFHFICDRGVSHEIVRHRPASYAQESTRYCNYAGGKFGEITYVKPTGWDSLPYHTQARYEQVFYTCEDEYARLISYGQTPQQARAVLPNALKTEVIMTAPAKEYEHFFDLRSRGVTGAPHPDIKVVADMALTMYEVERAMILGV